MRRSGPLRTDAPPFGARSLPSGGLRPSAGKAVALLLLFLACGKGAVSAKDFPAAFAKAVCQVQQTCRGAADYLEQDCENGSRALYDPDLPKALAAGKVTFDAQQAQACLDGLHARGCGRTAPEVDQL